MSLPFDLEIAISVAALAISLGSLIFSAKASHLQNKVNILEEKIKRIELAEKEKQLAKRQESCVEVRYMRISDKRRYVRISNTGGVRAFNVRYKEVGDGGNAVFMHDKEPVEYLDPGNSYDEAVILTYGGVPKSKVEAIWETEDGQGHCREYLLTF